MGFVFSTTSERNLASCDMRIQQVLREAIRYFDFAVVCGYRSKDEQFELYKNGRTQRGEGAWVITDPKQIVTYCDGNRKASKHNRRPSLAVDCVPCGADGRQIWSDPERFQAMSAIIQREARVLGIKITWGGTWKMKDLPHFEV